MVVNTFLRFLFSLLLSTSFSLLHTAYVSNFFGFFVSLGLVYLMYVHVGVCFFGLFSTRGKIPRLLCGYDSAFFRLNLHSQLNKFSILHTFSSNQWQNHVRSIFVLMITKCDTGFSRCFSTPTHASSRHASQKCNGIVKMSKISQICDMSDGFRKPSQIVDNRLPSLVVVVVVGAP